MTRKTKKTEKILFNCDSDEKAQVHTLARAQHISMSEVMRRLIKKAFDEYQDAPAPTAVDNDDSEENWDDDPDE